MLVVFASVIGRRSRKEVAMAIHNSKLVRTQCSKSRSVRYSNSAASSSQVNFENQKPRLAFTQTSEAMNFGVTAERLGALHNLRSRFRIPVVRTSGSDLSLKFTHERVPSLFPNGIVHIRIWTIRQTFSGGAIHAFSPVPI